MKDVVDIERFLPSIYSNSNVYVVRLIWREANLHAHWHEIKQSAQTPSSRADLQQLLQTALDLDRQYQAWDAMIPSQWRYQMESNTLQARARYDPKWQKLLLEGGGAPEEIHAYSSLKRCWIWGFYRTSRIFLLRDTLEMLNWCFRLPMHQPQTDIATGNIDDSTSGLDDRTLWTHHALATANLVNIIETSCSAIIGNFTVPIHGKSPHDIGGMRGYVSLWPLGIMDAVLASGLVPDSNSTTNNTSNLSQHAQHQPPHHQSTPQAHQQPSIVTTPAPKPESYATAPQFSELSKLTSITSSPSSTTSPVSTNTAVNAPSTTPLTTLPSLRKCHIFESAPAHPNDRPLTLPLYDATAPEPRRIDVAARREWLNRMLYYIASELGIKKALYVPITEGFMQRVKPSVDAILGRG